MFKRLVLGLAVAGALFMVTAAQAGARDRNHDRIPDRWEKRHHLSLEVNQAKRDQDRDGMRNRAEFRARMDPRDKDSDDDGVRDDDENAGRIASFKDGILTISLFAGGEISGRVTGATEIECDDNDRHDAGDDDNPHADDDGGGDHHGGPGDDHRAHAASGDDDACAPAALTPGAIVEEAELDATAAGATWDEIELR